MARYDETTRAFIDKIAGPVSHQKEQEEPAPLKPEEVPVAKKVLSATKKIVQGTRSPKDFLPRQAVALATRELLKEGGTSVLKIYEILNDNYKEDWWDWEPETIWQSLTQDHALEPEEGLKNLAMALQVISRTDAPFEHWHIFEKIGHALNGNHVDFQVLQPLGLEEAAFTVYIMDTIRPTEEFEDEILGYIAAIAKHSGVVYLPHQWFDHAQRFLDGMGNDLELAAEIARRVESTIPAPKPEDTPAIKIQLLSLKEVEDYVKEHA